MNDDKIKHMVNRFLGWKLPENFNPDAGISFKAAFNEHTASPMKHEPTGTNLFDATQADSMVRYMVDGIDTSENDGWQPIETAPKNEMFIWATPKGEGKWSLGLAYRNVSGGWSDAYGGDAPRHATRWHRLPAPPVKEEEK